LIFFQAIFQPMKHAPVILVFLALLSQLVLGVLPGRRGVVCISTSSDVPQAVPAHSNQPSCCRHGHAEHEHDGDEPRHPLSHSGCMHVHIESDAVRTETRRTTTDEASCSLFTRILTIECFTKPFDSRCIATRGWPQIGHGPPMIGLATTRLLI